MKHDDKKMTLIRLGIFLLIAFVPVVFIAEGIRAALGAPMYSTPELSAHPLTTLAGFGMLFPAIANAVARIATKQGIRDAMLEFNFKGRIRYYVMAFLIPVAYSTVGTIITNLCLGVNIFEAMTTEHFFENLPLSLALPPMIMAQMVLFFGEEFGWRGYLIPQLEKLMPTPAAVIVGGAVWGVWHAPLTVQGHNFGVDYPGFPYLGILFMTLDCIFMGAFLTYITKKTSSVWPAAIAHGINNGGGVMLLLLFISPDAEIGAGAVPEADIISQWLLYLIPVAVLGTVCYILLCRDYIKERKNKNAAETELPAAA